MTASSVDPGLGPECNPVGGKLCRFSALKLWQTDTTTQMVTQGLTQLQQPNAVEMDTMSVPVELPSPDVDTSISEFLGRPRFITRLTWTPSDTIATELYTGSILTALLSMTAITNKLKGFAQMRAKLNVRITAVGSAFHAGTLIASWGCSGGQDTYRTGSCAIPLQTLSQRSTLPHLYISANEGGSQEMMLDTHSPYPYLETTNTTFKYENLRITVMNPLKWYSTVVAGVTLAPNVNVAVYAWFSDVELCTPVPQSEMSGAVGGVGKKVSSARGFASKFAHMALDVGLTAAGLGNPAEPARPAFVTDAHPFRQKADGVSQVDTLFMHNVVEAPITPMGQDEMDFKSIYTKEAYLTQIEWSDAVVPQQLYYAPVSPVLASETGLVATGRTGGSQYLPMGFIALPFQYWRGSIKFRIQIVAPKMVRGVLRLQYLPRSYSVPSYFEDTGDTYCMLLDIAQGADAEMVIPYTANLPWLEVVGPITTTGSAATTNGMFVISIVEPLVSNGVGVSVNVFASGVDLEFANMYGVRSSLSEFSFGKICMTEDLFPQTGTIDVFRSIRDAVKVPCRCVEWYDSLAANVEVGVIMDIDTGPISNGADTLASDDICLTPLAWYSAGFLARRGKVRTSMVSNYTAGSVFVAGADFPRIPPIAGVIKSTTPLAFSYVLTGTYESTIRTLTESYHVYGSNSGCESVTVDVPSYSMGSYTFARPRYAAYSRPIVRFVMPLGSMVTTSQCATMFSIYQCASDDFALDHFQFVPIIFNG